MNESFIQKLPRRMGLVKGFWSEARMWLHGERATKMWVEGVARVAGGGHRDGIELATGYTEGNVSLRQEKKMLSR
jgi:hypothetical protein